MSILSKNYFHDEAAAFKHVEATLWPEGPVCPHCGGNERIYELKGLRSKPSRKNPEGIVRHGVKKCGHCRKQFTVRAGTIFEESHLPMHKWLQAIYLMVSSKKGISAHQLHRVLEVQYKTAWFLAHRIREAMRSGELDPMGGAGSIVEVDETFIGKQDHVPHKHLKRMGRGAHAYRNVVLTLVQRGGSARSFVVMGQRISDIAPIVNANIDRETRFMTDDGVWYPTIGRAFATHDTINHKRKEYARGDVTTNTVEGYYSIFKRGMKGVYQHCKEKHLHRYLAEFDFRYSNRVALGIDDTARATRALMGVKGKRLTYNQPRFAN